MTPAEVAITATLGASALTGAVSLSVVGPRESLQRKASNKDALHRAVRELLTRSIVVAMWAKAMRDAIRFRSGLMEGVDVVILRLRKPVDAMALYDWQAPDLVLLNAALNEVWTRWDQEGMRLASDLVHKCADLLSESTTLVPAKTPLQRARKALIGERWTPQREDAYNRALEDMLAARMGLANYARRTLRLKDVDLLAEVEPPKEYGISRTTAQKVIRALADQGLVDIKPRWGVFVSGDRSK
jgi:hypothetical protein